MATPTATQTARKRRPRHDNAIGGRRLSDLREARGWDRAYLARLLGVTPITIRRWESGTSEPEGDHRRQLVRVFGVPVGFLLGFGDFEGYEDDDE